MRHTLSIVVIVAAAMACVPLSAAQTPSPLPMPQLQIPGFDYRAETRAPARRQGNVSANGIAWSCTANACTTRRPWPAPTVEACRALAAEIGAITSFGREGARLSSTELAQCNAAVAIARPQVQLLPPPRVQTIPGAASTTAAVILETPELSFVGGAMVETADRTAPAIVVTTPELSFVGGSMADTADRSAPPVIVDVPELSFVGR